MEKELLLKVREALANQGIAIKSDGTGFKANDKNKADIILKTMNVSADAYIAAEQALKAAERMAQFQDMPAHIATNFSRIQYVHPNLDALPIWSSGDKRWFGTRFLFSRDQIDSAPMMFIKVTDTRYAAVPMTRSKSQMRAQISSILAISTPNHPDKYPNLYEELLHGIDDMFKYILDQFNNKAIKSNDELANMFIKWLPASMIKSYPIQMTVCTEVYGERKLTIPHTAYFAKDGVKIDAITHLVEHFDMLAGNKDLCLPEIPAIYTNDPAQPSLHYLDLDSVVEHGPHPTWDKYFARFRPEEARVIRAFFWSIFDSTNNSRQALYIEDKDGFSAKSAVMRVISHYLGDDLVAAIQKDSLSNQFGLAKLWDKRLVYIGDNKNPYLIRTEKMHMLLGGDLADIELKGQNSFTAKLNSKVIASGNIPLDIDPHARHERTRIIVVKPHVPEALLREFVLLDENGNIKRDKEGEPQFIGDNTFEPKLLAEFKCMMWDAREDYKALCPTGSSIILPDFMIEDLYNMSSSAVDAVDEIIERYFEIGDDKYAIPGDLRRTFNRASDALDANVKFDEFLVHISKKYNVEKKTCRKAGNVKAYIGIGIRDLGVNIDRNIIDIDGVETPRPAWKGLT